MMRKQIVYLFATFFLGSFILFSCNKEDALVPDKSGKLVFSLNEIIVETEGEFFKNTVAKEDAVAVIVTITGSMGDTLYYLEELELFNLNGSFITEAIILPEGNYELTEFLVIDEESNVIYITPLEGSNYAYLVSVPLGIGFEVIVDQITKVIPEVITTDCICTAIDFGYVGFDFNVVDLFCILINVQVYDEIVQNYTFVSTDIVVEGDGVVLYNGVLPARTDSLKIPDGYEEYSLLFSMEDIPPLDTSFSNVELKHFIAEPLSILMDDNYMTDNEGNYYRTVTIGEQIWMAENLAVFVRNDGTLPPGYSRHNPVEYYDFEGNTAMVNEYGLLYNPRYINNYVPDGWHVPTDDEWKELEMYLGMSQEDADLWGYTRGTNQGDLLKAGGGTGFNALFAGYAHWYSPPPSSEPLEYIYSGEGFSTYFLSSTMDRTGLYYPNFLLRIITRSYSGIQRRSHPSRYRGQYYSVRCVKD